MKTCFSDPYLYFKRLNNLLIELCTSYIDDTLHTEDENYSNESHQTEQEFKCDEREYDNIQFAGLQIETTADIILIYYKRNIMKFCRLSPKNNFDACILLRAKLAWCTKSRANISCAVATQHIS